MAGFLVLTQAAFVHSTEFTPLVDHVLSAAHT